MSKPFAIGFACAVVVLGLALTWIFYSQRGNYLAPTGKILAVRTAAIDENSAALIVDFEATNPSGREMVVRSIHVNLHRPDGSTPDGSLIAASDLPALFRYHPELGQMGVTAMRERDHIKPGETVERMTAVRYEMPKAELQKRKDVQLVIEDVTGPKIETTAR